jgi:DNA-binding PadR family transcriptional regulator
LAKADSLWDSVDLLVLKILSRLGLYGYAMMSAFQLISGEVLRVEIGHLVACFDEARRSSPISERSRSVFREKCRACLSDARRSARD